MVLDNVRETLPRASAIFGDETMFGVMTTRNVADWKCRYRAKKDGVKFITWRILT